VAAVNEAPACARARCPCGQDVLLLGRKNTTCKECLPYIVTTGSFLAHLGKRGSNDRVSLCFMPSGGGPCRLGQYGHALNELIHRERMENVAVIPA
jgi:predicted nucleotide-binding protein (sugar kinase/HSP70/actin superfamily)